MREGGTSTPRSWPQQQILARSKRRARLPAKSVVIRTRPIAYPHTHPNLIPCNPLSYLGGGPLKSQCPEMEPVQNNGDPQCAAQWELQQAAPPGPCSGHQRTKRGAGGEEGSRTKECYGACYEHADPKFWVGLLDLLLANSTRLHVRRVGGQTHARTPKLKAVEGWMMASDTQPEPGSRAVQRTAAPGDHPGWCNVPSAHLADPRRSSNRAGAVFHP